MPLFGPPDVMKLVKQKDVKGLIKALNYKNSAVVRGEAASMLGELGGAEVIGALIGALQDVDAGVRRKAVSALDHLRTERALEPLIALIQKEPDRIVRHFAIMAVSNSKDVRILKPLLSMVEAHGLRLTRMIHSHINFRRRKARLHSGTNMQSFTSGSGGP
jgi:HEAT repeat protein